MGKHESHRGEQPGIDRRDLLTFTLYTAVALPVSRCIGNALSQTAAGAVLMERGRSLPSPHNEINKPPKEIPPAVAAMQYSVVSIEADSNTKYGESLSGVVLDANHVITAGHGVRDIYGYLYPFDGCGGEIEITGRDAKGNPIRALSSRIESSYREGSYFIPDVTLIETQEPIDTATLIRPVLRQQPVNIGEPLFFINYEPTANNENRDPLSNNRNLRYPAIFGGIVQSTWNGLVVVELGEQNYGRGFPDTTLRGGSSGGGVYDQNGFLVGISNRSTIDGGYTGYVQPVTTELKDSLYYSLQIGKHSDPDGCSNHFM